MSGLILVTGATGKQGGAVLRHLIALGAPVRAMTRRPDSDAAEALRQLGAEVVHGDLDNPASLDAALVGVRAVFSVQDFWTAGYDGEIRHGTHLAQAAARAGAFVLQSTMATAARDGGGPRVPHYESKRAVERALAATGAPHAMLGTVFYMDNVLDPALGGPLTLPALAGSLGSDVPFDMVAVDDLGAVAARVLVDAERYAGTRVDVVGDRLTVPEMRAAVRRATGRRPRWWSVPRWALRRVNAEFAEQLAWHRAVNFAPETSVARRLVPELRSWEAFVRAHGVTNL